MIPTTNPLQRSGMRRGRKPLVDDAALVMMAHFNLKRIHSGKQPNDREAAREAIRILGLQDAHVSDGAIEDRLRGKYRRDREALLAAAIAELKIFSQ